MFGFNFKYLKSSMASLRRLPKVLKDLGTIHQLSRTMSVSTTAHERFGTSEGGSGWSWDKGGAGMGGKERGLATEIKQKVVKGKGNLYQAPEFFEYTQYSYFDVEKEMAPKRVRQPSSGLSEYWGDSEKGRN